MSFVKNTGFIAVNKNIHVPPPIRKNRPGAVNRLGPTTIHAA
jgi:hypothetical protein